MAETASPDEDKARLGAAKQVNERLRALLTEKDREVFLLKEKLYDAINRKKDAVAAAAKRAEAQAEAAAKTPVQAGVKRSPFARRNTPGDPVQVAPRISPRTKRLAAKHLTTEEYAGNYGQRLYQYGVESFHRRVEEKVHNLSKSLTAPLERELCAICRSIDADPDDPSAKLDRCRCQVPAAFLPVICPPKGLDPSLTMTMIAGPKDKEVSSGEARPGLAVCLAADAAVQGVIAKGVTVAKEGATCTVDFSKSGGDAEVSVRLSDLVTSGKNLIKASREKVDVELDVTPFWERLGPSSAPTDTAGIAGDIRIMN